MCEGGVLERRPCLDAVTAGGPQDEGGAVTSGLASRGYSIKGLLQKPKPHTSILLAMSRSGAPVAVKVMRCLSPSERREAIRELCAMDLSSRPPSPFVVPLLEAFMDEARTQLLLVMPYLKGGDLLEHVLRRGGGQRGVPEAEASALFRQMVQGVMHLHSRGIAHGDVSLENVVVAESGACCLIDLGSSCKAGARPPPPQEEPQPQPQPQDRNNGRHYRYRGKWAYAPPEVAHGREEEKRGSPGVDVLKVDVWALGASLFPLLTGRRLYESPTDPAFTQWLAQGRAAELLQHYQAYTPISTQARDLLCRLLEPDPQKRPSLMEVLAHPWLWLGLGLTHAAPGHDHTNSNSNSTTNSSTDTAALPMGLAAEEEAAVE